MKFSIVESYASKSPVAILLLLLAIFASSAISIAAQKAAPQANPNLDQCANGPVSGPRQPCTGANWLAGNLVRTNSQFVEGQSVPYRLVYQGVAGVSSSITIEWDTTKMGKYAFDYLTTYDRTEINGNDPCSGVGGCSLFTKTTFPIPPDPDVAAGFDHVAGNGDDIVQIPGIFTLFGGTITSVSSYGLAGNYSGDSTRSITVNFDFGPTGTAVLAWSGHIGRRAEWGLNNTVVAATGLPYHLRAGGLDAFIDVNAVIYPGSLTIVKRVANLDGTFSSTRLFNFSSSANFGVTGFSLVDSDASELGGGSITNAMITADPADPSSVITVTELPAPGYSLSDLSCIERGGGFPPVNNTVVDLASATATIIVDDYEFVTCTFTNAQITPSAANAIVSGRVMNSAGYGLRNAIVTATDSQGNVRSAITSTFGYYTLHDLPVGQSYVVIAKTKGTVFSPRFVVLDDAISGVDFIAGQN